MQVRTWFGIFSIQENKIVDVELFEKDSIIDHLMEEPLLLRGSVSGIDLGEAAVKYGFVQSKDEYDRLLHEINIRLVKEQISRSATPDTQIIAAVEAIDDLNETSNLLAERLKEWYVQNSGHTDLKGKQLALHIIREEENIPANVKGIMHDLAQALLKLYDTRLAIDNFLKENMPLTAPNLTNTAGYILGARLISAFGSLEKLASVPSSTVQVIGASNALFKHLKGKASSPKHGLIFRHPVVNTAPRQLRGKLARLLASKITLAARYDFYSGELKEELTKELELKVQEIKKRS